PAVALPALLLLAGGRVPQPERPRLVAGEDPLAVGREGGGPHRAAVALEGGDRPASASHTRTTPSSPADSTRLPSGEKRRQRTGLRCSCRQTFSAFPPRFHRRTPVSTSAANSSPR